jgi:hypothetical protein
MNSDVFLLWGIDGELRGSEHLLQMRLPMFTRAGEDGVVYIARHVQWSPALLDSEVVRVSPERAAECGDRLDIPPTPIAPAQFAVVIGPELRRNLAALIRVPVSRDAVDRNGFSVLVRNVADAERLAKDLEARARRVFDRETASGVVTKKARAALAVMRNVAVGDVRAHLLRTLVMYFLDTDTDQYRRVLRLAEKRLHDSAAVIEREVRQQLDLSRRMTRRQGHIPISAAMKSLSARGHVGRRRSPEAPRRQHE